MRSDPKNLVYFLQEDRAAPGHFIFYEVFASVEDFEAHNAMPYVKERFTNLPALAEGVCRSCGWKSRDMAGGDARTAGTIFSFRPLPAQAISFSGVGEPPFGQYSASIIDDIPQDALQAMPPLLANP